MLRSLALLGKPAASASGAQARWRARGGRIGGFEFGSLRVAVPEPELQVVDGFYVAAVERR